MKKHMVRNHLLVFFVIFLSLVTIECRSHAEDMFSMAQTKKISLDLKGMDIVEVIKTLATQGKLNVVVGSNVRGKVTMFLKDVNIDDAFEIILLANNLASDGRGDIIYVMTQRDYEQLYGERYGDKKEAKIIPLKFAKATDVSNALNQIKTKIGKVIVDEASNTIIVVDTPQAVENAMKLVAQIDKPTVTRIIELNYASVEDIKEKIQEMLTKNIGEMQVDQRTNKIVVTDLESKVEDIEKVILAFDSKSKQVLIEAKILEITLTDDFSLGVDWQAVLDDLQKRLYPGIKNPISFTNAFKLATSGGLVPGAELLVGDFGSDDYHVMVQILQSVGDVNTLSNPRITVLNNEEAKILIGSSEPYATNTVTQGTSTTTTATNLTFLEIGVKLYVTPTINKDGFISMKIKPEVSSATGSYTYGDPETTVPIVSTTEAETSVIIKDGHTIIIAGLIKDNRSDTVKKIPFLGDIPIIDLGFKRQEQSIEKKELVIFLTPHIISGEADILDVPQSYPVGEDVFTTGEKPGFRRRHRFNANPTLFKDQKEGDGKREKKILSNASPREYYAYVKGEVMDNIVITEEEANYLQYGDTVEIAFTLFSGGHLLASPEVLRSSNAFFDRIAVEAVKRSVPLQSFPSSIKEPKKRFVMEIVYKPESKEKKEKKKASPWFSFKKVKKEKDNSGKR